MSALLEVAFAAVREAARGPVVLLDVVHSAPLVGPACVVVEGDSFRIERRGQVFLSGRFTVDEPATGPSLRSIHATADEPAWAELAAEHDVERRFYHVHPTMLASALDEVSAPIGRVGRIALGRRCGAWCWIHSEVTSEGKTVVLYDHDGEVVMRLDGVVAATKESDVRAA
jgi:hypothetical protein